MGSVSRGNIVPLRRLEPHCPYLVWEAKASDKLVSPISVHGTVHCRSQPVTESQLWGTILHRPTLRVGGRRLSATEMFVPTFLTVRTCLGHFSQVTQIFSVI